jgi:hypothetical protein
MASSDSEFKLLDFLKHYEKFPEQRSDPSQKTLSTQENINTEHEHITYPDWDSKPRSQHLRG